MVSQLTVIDAAFLSRSVGGGDKKDTWRERSKREKIKTSGETDASQSFTDPLSTKETAADCSAAPSNLSLIPRAVN